MLIHGKLKLMDLLGNKKLLIIKQNAYLGFFISNNLDDEEMLWPYSMPPVVKF